MTVVYRALVGGNRALWFVACAVVLGVQTASAQGAASSTSYDSTIARADDHVRAGDYVRGLAEAQRAIQLDPSEFRGYYYAAFALFKQGLAADAAPLAERALSLSPADSKSQVQELLGAVRGRRTQADHLRAAEAALEQGMPAKAAAEYAAAWQAAPEDEHLAIKAAELWGDRVGEPGRAVALLRAIVQQPKTLSGIEAARQLLPRYEAAQEQSYRERMARGQGLAVDRRYADAIAAFEEAASVAPDRTSPYIALAEVYALQGRRAELASALREAGARDGRVEQPAVVDALVSRNAFKPFLGEGFLTDLVSSGYGATAARRVREAHLEDTRQKRAALRRSMELVVGRWTGHSSSGYTTNFADQLDISLTEDLAYTAAGPFKFEIEYDYGDVDKFAGHVDSLRYFAKGARRPASLSAPCPSEREDCYVLYGKFRYQVRNTKGERVLRALFLQPWCGGCEDDSFTQAALVPWTHPDDPFAMVLEFVGKKDGKSVVKRLGLRRS